MALFLIILMIIGIRIFGWIVRNFGKIFGVIFGIMGLILVTSVLFGLIGLLFNALPLLFVIGIIYWATHNDRACCR